MTGGRARAAPKGFVLRAGASNGPQSGHRAVEPDRTHNIHADRAVQLQVANVCVRCAVRPVASCRCDARTERSKVPCRRVPPRGPPGGSGGRAARRERGVTCEGMADCVFHQTKILGSEYPTTVHLFDIDDDSK